MNYLCIVLLVAGQVYPVQLVEDKDRLGHYVDTEQWEATLRAGENIAIKSFSFGLCASPHPLE